MKAVGPICIVAVLGATSLAGSVALAQWPDRDSSAPRLLFAPAPTLPRDGIYSAGDNFQFMLESRDQQVRLRFSDSEEIFYLTSEPAPLGGRVLKYDTGEVALLVAGWGGVTIYTQEARGGLPAERQGELTNFEPTPLAPAEVKPFAAMLAFDMSVKEKVAVGYAADWADLQRTDTSSDVRRTLARDSMRNAAYAIARVARSGMRSSLAKGLHIVRVIQGPTPGAILQGGVLTVSYTPAEGPSARPSSLTIARALQPGS